MPPKPIISAEDILSAALSLVRAKGIESVNARSLAELLGCSTKPLFRLYKNMDELKQDLFFYINKYCSDYLLGCPNFDQDPIGVALRYISFAKNEPAMFKALFMSNSITKTTIASMILDKDIEQLQNEMSRTAQISRQEAQSVYKKMWLLSHGIASIIASNKDSFELADVEAILVEAYQGFVLSVKDGGQSYVTPK